MKVHVKIRGIAPLLMHKFSEEKLLKTNKRAGDKAQTPEAQREIASQYLYTDEKGVLKQPSIHLEMAFAKSATEFKLAGSGKKSYKEIVQSACFIDEEYLTHENQEWIVDARAAVNPSTRGRMMCYRPRLNEWSLSFNMDVLDDRADLDVIKQIIEYAGLHKGIGSYRPRFGRFELVEFTDVK